ncbi:MAG: hypothetical protein COW01_01920 [Bdellovibrionales bacterium CG12_big_fil_rev_8_21_14_0_65_38_15]|nr:MAG: hypothetical protein COW79_02155 [Bdellovibrionales bacterium CG22_combo_CG10-13_8_21_14_all_38_13]PIQ57064.1 MAG: hypothetical protein COW01_01920 [Bdellovibrionales bacterium CG12_big_fil_rev_8_21_14_0_65_38_15]PIR30094.1 MAG: hypothetical protein COV38_07315 [Bdellovibrionales bacterium CG11_big_fil_rev_8_21_14_0_20_38_13]
MKFISYLFVIGLSFIAFDFPLLRRRRSLLFTQSEEALDYGDTLKKEKTQKRYKKYKNTKYSKNKFRSNKKDIYDTKAKCHRYSNHKMLRRMYRND